MQQQEIRITFFIIGIVIISAVLLHGLWTIRKNKKKSKRSSFESKNWEPGFQHEDDLDDDGPFYDDIGVGKARVIVNPDTVDRQTIENNANNEQIDNAQIDEQASLQAETDLIDTDEANEQDTTGDVAFVSAMSENERSQNERSQNEKAQTEGDSVDAEELDSDNQGAASNEALVNNNENSHDNSHNNSEVQIAKSAEPQSPVYSNVVTQPKPEFNKPAAIKESSVESFGQPPEFLLKKTQTGTEAEGLEVASKKTEQNETVRKEKAPVVEDTSEKSKAQSGEPKPTPEFSLNIQEGPEIKETPKTEAPGVEKELSFAEQAKRFVRRNKKTVADKIRKEPVLKTPAEDQMRIDFDDNELMTNADKTQDEVQQTSAPAVKEPYTGEPEVLVLNVRADNDAPIEGAALLPMLLTLGFKFGEHDIFHRHVNTNGKGPILFSLTNMFKPGVFDIDNIENFNTLGVSLFMMLPIEGDAQQVFNMMHNAARKLSDEFGCRILDGNKVGLSKQSLQQYVERIRDFERKRINQ